MFPLPNNFRYLNREGAWLDFHWSGLSLNALGELQLLASPRVEGEPPDLTAVPAPDAPSGIAVDESGRTFYTVPDQNHVRFGGGCSEGAGQIASLQDSDGLTGLNQPRGLLILPETDRLVVVDSGNHRLLFFHLRDLDLREVWGQENLAANPVPGSAPGRFDTPWTVSADGDGNLYVLDYGNRRVQKCKPTREPVPHFAANLEASACVPHPGALAVHGAGEDVSVFVFDRDKQAIFVFDGRGHLRRNADGEPILIQYPGMSQVLALAVTDDTLYAGDNHLRQVLAFRREPGYPFAGSAAGFEGPVAALAVDPRGGLAVSAGNAAEPLAMTTNGAFLPRGVLWSEGISSGVSAALWNRLRADVHNAEGSHVEFHFSLSHSATAPPVNLAADDPFGDPKWSALPQDVEDFLLGGAGKTRYLFVGAVFRSDRTATPRLRQIRADFDDPGYLRSLPAIYRQPENDADFLRRLLALFQGIFDDLDSEMESLVRCFHPYVAPEEALPWLATWLALDTNRGEPVARVRAAIAQAFYRYQWRGTAEGLRLALLEDAGVHAHVVQPVSNTSVWSFAGDTHCSGVASTPPAMQLGAATQLAGVEPGGAVLGSTAHMDHSYLIPDARFGDPLFSGTAYQFVVEVHRHEVAGRGRMERVKEIVEREKPAHTMWQLSVLDAPMRVGFQARTGIDSIIAGTPSPAGLGKAELRLSGDPAARIGGSRVGRNSRLER